MKSPEEEPRHVPVCFRLRTHLDAWQQRVLMFMSVSKFCPRHVCNILAIQTFFTVTLSSPSAPTSPVAFVISIIAVILSIAHSLVAITSGSQFPDVSEESLRSAVGAEGIQPLLRPPGSENVRFFHVVLVP